ncbi:hypothetical protein BjapCC829_21730 [Bradyrhizobium barranii]|uniref:Uncharacterized protein n=1 Tax=Bradyrhizobium barranii TaxID=2992140 RepID=A0ABY3QZZ2_9BRAD|nr:hypothetical protein [Bradyrhizobium japonicum]UFW91014.1 hypothetical protein BjapCC829_21730 [Bradyrhizobium japonicum]
MEGVLGRAKELLQSEGWWQPGDGNPASGRRCAHEAILDACNGVSRLNGKPAVFILSRIVAPEGRGTSIELVEWNDRRGRTREEVMSAFDQAISRAREAGR